MRRTLTATLAGLALILGLSTAHASDRPETLEEGLDIALREGNIAASIADISLTVEDIRLDDSVIDIESERTEGDDTVVSLASDILFEFGKSDLNTNATTRIAEVVRDLPDGAEVEVTGHTDSIGTDEFNQTLSEDRAAAVAAVLREERPDVRLTVEGKGPHEPVADNTRGGEDYPEGRAQNRRVEIRFDS